MPTAAPLNGGLISFLCGCVQGPPPPTQKNLLFVCAKQLCNCLHPRAGIQQSHTHFLLNLAALWRISAAGREADTCGVIVYNMFTATDATSRK